LAEAGRRIQKNFDAARVQVMNRKVDNSAHAALSRFLIDSEIPVRQLAELATANATSVRTFYSGEREHKELVIVADLLLEQIPVDFTHSLHA
jgi:hypothetical protein